MQFILVLFNQAFESEETSPHCCLVLLAQVVDKVLQETRPTLWVVDPGNGGDASHVLLQDLVVVSGSLVQGLQDVVADQLLVIVVQDDEIEAFEGDLLGLLWVQEFPVVFNGRAKLNSCCVADVNLMTLVNL